MFGAPCAIVEPRVRLEKQYFLWGTSIVEAFFETGLPSPTLRELTSPDDDADIPVVQPPTEHAAEPARSEVAPTPAAPPFGHP